MESRSGPGLVSEHLQSDLNSCGLQALVLAQLSAKSVCGD